MTTEQEKKEGFYGWISLGMAAAMFFVVNGGVMFSFGAFLPSICKDLGWSRGEVSVVALVMMLIGTFVSIGAGFFIARYGARRAIVSGNIIIAAGFILLSMFHAKVGFFTGYALLGVGLGLGGQITALTIAQNWFVKRVPLAMGVLQTAGGIGGFIIIPLVMGIINHAGWRPAYVALGVIVLVVNVILVGLFIRNKPEDMGQVPDGIESPTAVQDKVRPKVPPKFYVTPVHFTVREAMATPAFWLLIVLGDVPLFLLGMLTAHQIAFLTDMGISSQTAAIATGVMTGTMAVGNLLMGFLGLRYNTLNLAMTATGFMLLGTILALLTKSVGMGFAYSIAFGIGCGGTMVATASFWAGYFGRTNFPKIMGIAGFFRIIVGAGAPVAGYLYDRTNSYDSAHMVAIAIALLGVITAIVLRPPIHKLLKVQEAVETVVENA
jgi:MFS family permease